MSNSKILTSEEVGEIEARPWFWPAHDQWRETPMPERNVLLSVAERDALCATVRHLLSENARVYTPSICEALKLLDDAGYGAEVPNSLSEMIKKVLEENGRLKAERNALLQSMNVHIGD